MCIQQLALSYAETCGRHKQLAAALQLLQVLLGGIVDTWKVAARPTYTYKRTQLSVSYTLDVESNPGFNMTQHSSIHIQDVCMFDQNAWERR
jgi:hypothetical protein